MQRLRSRNRLLFGFSSRAIICSGQLFRADCPASFKCGAGKGTLPFPAFFSHQARNRLQVHALYLTSTHTILPQQEECGLLILGYSQAYRVHALPQHELSTKSCDAHSENFGIERARRIDVFYRQDDVVNRFNIHTRQFIHIANFPAPRGLTPNQAGGISHQPNARSMSNDEIHSAVW